VIAGQPSRIAPELHPAPDGRSDDAAGPDR